MIQETAVNHSELDSVAHEAIASLSSVMATQKAFGSVTIMIRFENGVASHVKKTLSILAKRKSDSTAKASGGGRGGVRGR